MKTRNVLAMVSPMSAERVSSIARYAKEHGWNLMIQDRLFHTQLGHSVGEEIRRRFAQVKLLLETSHEPISSIAMKTGYCTPAHLTNAFKAAFGMTPKSWRNRRLSRALSSSSF